MARYVVRLSMALGDLRIAARYATRARQNSAERLYLVRLTASHLRELILIMDPPDPNVIPRLEEFLASLPRGTKPSRTDIRRSHTRALRMLDLPMASGRPEIVTSKGKRRRPTLRDDIKELRNRFFHYGHDRSGDDALRVAMAALQGAATGYVIRQRTMRALYADDVGAKLAHPFDVRFAYEMHGKVGDLIGPAALFVQQIGGVALCPSR